VLLKRSFHVALLGFGLVTSLAAQEMPWHLVSSAQSAAAPSSVNTQSIKAGAHQIVVAVIDSGVLGDHPSLAGQMLPGYDMLSAPNNLRGNRSTNYSPDERDARCGQRLVSGAFRTHGTEVASLIAGNGVDGVFGVNPLAKILPIRLFGACNMTRADMLDAISWAAGLPVDGVPPNPHPARVINMSIAGGLSVCGPDLQQVITRVLEKKVFVVAAAGNNFHKPLPEPANCKGVISVGALDAENKIEVYSALDTRTTLYAPGGGKRLSSSSEWSVNKLKVATYDLDFTGNERSAALFRGVGTSYAAPVVAGFISLWLSHHPDKQSSDFAREMPKFLRPVEPIDKCPECTPRGVTAAAGMAKP
jgi:serine protease